MVREPLGAPAEPAEVDDPIQPGGLGGLGEVPRGEDVALAERVLAGGHRVDQVVGGAAAVERRAERRGVEHVPLDHLDLIAPAAPAEPFRVASQAADAIPFGQELGHQTAADIARGPRDEDRLRRRHRVNLAIMRTHAATCQGRENPAGPEFERIEPQPRGEPTRPGGPGQPGHLTRPDPDLQLKPRPAQHRLHAPEPGAALAPRERPAERSCRAQVGQLDRDDVAPELDAERLGPPPGSSVARRRRAPRSWRQLNGMVAGADLEHAVHLPLRVRRVVRRAAGDEQLEVLEMVGDLGAAPGQAFVEADREVGPGLGVVRGRVGRPSVGLLSCVGSQGIRGRRVDDGDDPSPPLYAPEPPRRPPCPWFLRNRRQSIGRSSINARFFRQRKKGTSAESMEALCV